MLIGLNRRFGIFLIIAVALIGLGGGGIGIDHFVKVRAEKAECRRSAHFFHEYYKMLRQNDDVEELLDADAASFSVADGKTRDALRNLDELAKTQTEVLMAAGLRSEVRAYERCRLVSPDVCFALEQNAVNNLQKGTDQYFEETKPCDRFRLPDE